MGKTKVCFIIVCCLIVNIRTYSQCHLVDTLRTYYCSQIGVTELTGNNDGPKVKEYLATCGLPEGYAWCGAFVNACFIHCSIPVDVSYPARAASWAEKGELVWDKNNHRIRDEPCPTDVFTLYYESLGRIGHTGFINGVENNMFLTVEGNTNSGGSREGQGVWGRRRLKESICKINRYIQCNNQKQQSYVGLSYKNLSPLYFTGEEMVLEIHCSKREEPCQWPISWVQTQRKLQ